jgi:hypothetical protein
MRRRPYPRPIAERLIACLCESGSLTGLELAALTGTRSSNVSARLAAEIASGLIATATVSNPGYSGRVVRYEWRGEVAAPAASRPSSQRAERPLPRPARATQRPCLCCRRIFQSAGPHNRLCGNCRCRDVSPFAPDF